MTSEAKARQEIDRKLEQTGWVVQDLKKINLGAGRGNRGQTWQHHTHLCGRPDRTLRPPYP